MQNVYYLGRCWFPLFNIFKNNNFFLQLLKISLAFPIKQYWVYCILTLLEFWVSQLVWQHSMNCFQCNWLSREWSPKFATGLNVIYHNKKYMSDLCQNDVLLGELFWQKDSLVTHTLFKLCLLWYLAQPQILVTTFYLYALE